jgi:formylglycine-generating enzyme required for sulfatase activity
MRFAVAALLLALFAAPVSIHAITIDTVTIANPGNPADVQGFSSAGAVGYEFDLGKFEVTNAQYVDFLNAADPTGANLRGLYNSQMDSDARGGITFSSGAMNGSKFNVKSGRANNPVVFVTFFDAARFTNWLHNGQGAGNTEDGAYQLTGGTPFPLNGNFVTRKVTASWCLPTTDEWYKAAYHKNDGVTGNYFDYPTSNDTAPMATAPPGGLNSANFLSVVGGLTDAGAYVISTSPYGTFDQGGNVWEWTETLALELRRVAGGSWINAGSFLAASAQYNTTVASTEAYTVGFRVARVEPGLLPGDYNIDGAVDAADYTIWRDTLGSTSDLRANGDNTGPSAGLIDDADYDFWKANFGQVAGSAAIAGESVPEPSSLLILLAVLLPTMSCPYRRNEPLAA